MKRIVLGAAACLLASLACLVTTQDDQSNGGGDPSYKVVHGWPALPDGYALGQVTGVGVDSQNRVWVFHRA